MSREQVLDARVNEVLRTMPPGQAQEATRYAGMVRDASLHLEYGVWHTISYRFEGREKHLAKVGGIVSELAWSDLKVANTHDFPVPTPKSAMRIAETAEQYAEKLAQRADRDPKKVYGAVLGFVGLHNTILPPDQIEDDDTRTILTRALTTYKSDFYLPVYNKFRSSESGRRW